MARGQQTNRALVPGAERALDALKYEVARDLGVSPPPDGYWGDIPSRQNGAVGGHMVRRMIQIAEQSLAGTAGGPGAQFRGGAAGPAGAGGGGVQRRP
ncbi:MAG: alpha/beta-type small acid-soluble spore protein [bacterium]|nr:alpha/beta-type small acid-soluble spore protein [bacterium]